MERDHSRFENQCRRFHFNSHAHVERDDNITTIVSMIRNFNSHAHVERDSDVQEMVVSCYISTHTLTWSVTGTPSAALLVYLYFNSHAHVERDV